MHGRTLARLGMVCVLVIATMGGGMLGAGVAQTDDTDEGEDMDELATVVENDDVSTVAVIWAGFGEMASQIGYNVGDLIPSMTAWATDDPPQTTEQEAVGTLDDLVTDHEDELVNYINDRRGGSLEQYETVAVTVEEDADSTAETVYVDLETDTEGALTGVDVVEESDTVSHEIELEGYAAASMSDDLELFFEDYVTEDEDADATIHAKADAYLGSVDAGAV